jgi:hypothetical protein
MINVYHYFQSYSLMIRSQNALKRLQAHADVALIETNQHCSVGALQIDAQWNLMRISHRSKPWTDGYTFDDAAGSVAKQPCRG